ncbi:MAG: radical SAM protein [Peptostreptococcaceae bacterium]|nr:radical SAM protein [Peptostreptococcaceae bacterium]
MATAAILKEFEASDGVYLYSSDNGKLIKISHSLYRIMRALNQNFDINNICDKSYLKKFDLENTTESEILEAYTQIEKSGFLAKRSTKEKHVFNRLILMIAQDCNLACSYCFGNEGTYYKKGVMSFEIAKKAVDYMVENSPANKLYITFFGGEPLLYFSKLEDIVSYCREIERKLNKEFYFSITTNGTLIDDKVTNFFLKEKVKVQVSIDGNREMHDYNRKYKSGRGSYDDIILSTERIIKEASVLGKATISMKNINIVELFEHLYSLGFSSVPMTVAFSELEEEDYPVLALKMEEFVSHIYDLIKKMEFDKVRKISRTFNLLKMIHLAFVKGTLCGAGSSMRAVDIFGNVYPCHRLISEGEVFLMGNINFYVDEKKFENIAKTKPKCQECWIKGFCVGGCPATNHYLTGDYNIAPNYFCQYQRKYLEELFLLYIRLNSTEKKALFNHK